VRYHDFTADHDRVRPRAGRVHGGPTDIDSFDRRHHLTLIVVVTEAQMIVHRPGLEQAIRQGRAVVSGSSRNTRRRPPS
jgi:hypothetical protein